MLCNTMTLKLGKQNVDLPYVLIIKTERKKITIILRCGRPFVHPFIGLLSNQARLSRKQKKEEKAFEVNGNTLVPSIHCPRKTLANIKKVKRTRCLTTFLSSVFLCSYFPSLLFSSLLFAFFPHYNFYLLFAFSQ